MILEDPWTSSCVLGHRNLSRPCLVHLTTNHSKCLQTIYSYDTGSRLGYSQGLASCGIAVALEACKDVKKFLFE